MWLVLVLQGELPVRLQLESQVGDGLRCWYPVPWVFQVGTEAKDIQNAHFSKGQKLTHSPAREEKHAEQETPLQYTH